MTTRAEIIEKILLEGVETLGELYEKVQTELPDDNIKRIKGQYRAILKEITKGTNKRWNKYTVENNGLKITIKDE